MDIRIGGIIGSTMRKILAIGGGELKYKETLILDREIIALTGKKHPSILFIPTASGDAVGYWDSFRQIYGDLLQCKVDVLYLFNNQLSYEDIKEKIFSSDAIYVGGGNTLRMMNIWRKRRVDRLLTEAYEKGIVLSGLSAGAICWFQSGHSDSRKISGSENSESIRVRGLGLVPFIVCPHYHHEKREQNFEKMLKKNNLKFGISLDNNTGFEIVNNQFRIIKGNDKAKAYRVVRRERGFSREVLDNTDFKLLSSISE